MFKMDKDTDGTTFINLYDTDNNVVFTYVCSKERNNSQVINDFLEYIKKDLHEELNKINKGFTIKCNSCGTENTITDIQITANQSEYETEITIECEKCGNIEEIYS